MSKASLIERALRWIPQRRSQPSHRLRAARVFEPLERREVLSATWAISATSEYIAEDAAGTESMIYSLSGIVGEGEDASVTIQLLDITTDASDYQGGQVEAAVAAYAGPGSVSFSTVTGVLTYMGGVGGTSMSDLVVPMFPVDDSDFEYTESVEISLTNPTSGTGGTVTVDPSEASQTIHILDNDGTALDRYVAKPDASYAYSLVDTVVESGMTTYIIDMTSQTWRSAAEVDRTVWEHEVHIFVPDSAASATAILFIGSGDNGDPNQAIRRADAEEIAQHTGQITIYLPTVPNQSLTFTDDGIARREDGIMAYSFDKFLDGGDDEWPVLLPMVKSAVRAMDAAQEFLPANTAHTVTDFFVTGGSKRGWTTYLTAAADPRVSAITPVVFDYVNGVPAIEFHEHVYDGVTEGTVGGYAETLQSYVEFEVFDRVGTPVFDALVEMIDPYSYLDRLTQPKFAVLSTGDQFMPMAAQFYIKDFQGPTYLRYIPNTGHEAGRTEGKLFFAALDAGETLPLYDWTVESASANTIRLNTTDTPLEVKLWQATNPDSLDFRINYFGANWTSTVLTDQGGGEYVGSVPVPASGGTGFFLEMTYDVGGEVLTFTTEARIVEAPEWSIATTSPNIDEDAPGTESVIISLSGTIADGASASVMLDLVDITTDPSDYQNPGLVVVDAVNAYAGPGSVSYSIPAGGVLTYTGGVGGTSMADLVVPMMPVDDSLIEGDESLIVSLVNPTGAGIGQSQVSITILDDDEPPDAIAPTIQDIQVRGLLWPEGAGSLLEFFNTAGLGSDGFSIPVGIGGPVDILPWHQIDQVHIIFSEDVNVVEGDLSLTGVGTPVYSFEPGSFTYDPVTFTATWTLDNVLPDVLAEEFLIQLNGPVTDIGGNPLAGPTDGAFKVVVGDASQNENLGPEDYTLWANNFGQPLDASVALADTSANGTVGPEDYTLWANYFGLSVPTSPAAQANVAGDAHGDGRAVAADDVVSTNGDGAGTGSGSAIAGDYDGDGEVTLAAHSLWENRFGAQALDEEPVSQTDRATAARDSVFGWLVEDSTEKASLFASTGRSSSEEMHADDLSVYSVATRSTNAGADEEHWDLALQELLEPRRNGK